MATTGTTRRLDAGSLLIAAGAVLLLVSLFLDWYGAEDAFGSDRGADAWRVFELIDLLLAAIAVAALIAVFERILGGGPLRLPERALDAVGPAALVLVVYALINQPPVIFSDASPETGAWLALGAAITMTVGALLRGARVALVIDRDAGAGSPPSARPGTETHPSTVPTEKLDETGRRQPPEA